MLDGEKKRQRGEGGGKKERQEMIDRQKMDKVQKKSRWMGEGG